MGPGIDHTSHCTHHIPIHTVTRRLSKSLVAPPKNSDHFININQSICIAKVKIS
ncbi:hypothetical protein SAMN05216311_10344 [Chitinophaga sp. CF418]|nr:hypothetical protein SAMN05216311_10344 [Chitinophaga sp. CF418]